METACSTSPLAPFMCRRSAVALLAAAGILVHTVQAAAGTPATVTPAPAVPGGTGTGTTAASVWTLRTVPIRVDARLLHQEPAGPFTSRQYIFTITAHSAQGDQWVTTAIDANTLDDAVRSARAGTVWRSPYLFVHINRGTGDRADSSREAVYEIEDGRIRVVGQLVDRGDAPGSYHGRRFVDYWGTEASQYSRLCHGCVPILTVELADRDGKLEVRRGATWSANQDLWQSNAAIIAQPPGSDTAGADTDAGFSARLAYFQAVVKNAVLAKYVWKPTELSQLLNDATPHLNPEQRAALKEILNSVASLTPPSDSRPALYALNAGVQTQVR